MVYRIRWRTYANDGGMSCLLHHVAWILQLLCTNTRPVKTMLDIWPELPLVIYPDFEPSRWLGAANVITRQAGMDKSCQLMVQLMSNKLASPYMSQYFK